MLQFVISRRNGSFLFLKRLFSGSAHGGGEPSVGQVYNRNFKEFDEQLAKLRLDLITDPQEFDRLHRAGKISSLLAAQFKENLSHNKESEKAFKFWGRMFFFVGLPLCVLTGVNAFYMERKHRKHLEEHGPLEVADYDYMRIRNKPFPWGDGDHTLFHNPKTNGP